MQFALSPTDGSTAIYSVSLYTARALTGKRRVPSGLDADIRRDTPLIAHALASGKASLSNSSAGELDAGG